MKIKILRNFSVENKVFVKGTEVEVNNNFAGSSRYYELLDQEKQKIKKEEIGRKRKRIPDRQVKYNNRAILNKDKE